MDLEASVSQCKILLSQSTVVTEYEIRDVYDDKMQKSVIEIDMVCVRLKDSTSEFTHLLRGLRSKIPGPYPIRTNIKSVM